MPEYEVWKYCALASSRRVAEVLSNAPDVSLNLHRKFVLPDGSALVLEVLNPSPEYAPKTLPTVPPDSTFPTSMNGPRCTPIIFLKAATWLPVRKVDDWLPTYMRRQFLCRALTEARTASACDVLRTRLWWNVPRAGGGSGCPASMIGLTYTSTSARRRVPTGSGRALKQVVVVCAPQPVNQVSGVPVGKGKSVQSWLIIWFMPCNIRQYPAALFKPKCGTSVDVTEFNDA
mmetsp:Transcript_33069/g.105352  ORF Transcript_33069/g.105352 Transcript_33069/m.105352 type:complete len:231 (+) Transcript_33069:3155-3847(+)